MPEILRDAGSYAAACATLGILLLLPLYLAQRHDVQRLRRWRELEPERGEPVTGTFAAMPGAVRESGELTAAERITAERPALERITAERARWLSEPAWKRLLRRLPEPRHPMMIAAGAFLVGAGIFIGAMQIVEQTSDEPSGRGTDARAGTTVAVLNGSEIGGLAGKVGDDVKVNGFDLGRVTSIPKSYSQTVVMFAPGHQREGERVARALGVKPVQPLDRASAKAAAGADVVVIAGDDRAR